MSMSEPPRALQLVQETAIDRHENGDLIFRKEQFRKFDQHFKRRLAGKANTDEITGKSTLLEIESYFVRQRTLTEYAND